MTAPNWPGTPGFPALPARAGFARKSIQLPFATAGGESAATTPEILWGSGNPNGTIVGSPPDIFLSTDQGLWIKGSGLNTNTGWVQISSLQGASVGKFLEFRMIPEGHGAALNNGDPIDFPTGLARGTENVSQVGINTFAYLQGNSPDSMTFQFIDGRPCFKILPTLINHHTSPVFRPGGIGGRFPLDFFGATFGSIAGAFTKLGIAQPMSCSIMAWFRKIAGGDSSSARMFMGFADNTVVYSSNPVARCGLIGDGAGGYRYGSVNCPDGLGGGANGDSDRDANSVVAVAAPATSWWHSRIKLIPATLDTPASIACYHNGALAVNFTTATNWPRGGQGTTHDYTRIEACLRAWDAIPGLYLHDWRVWFEDDLTV